MSRSSVSGAFWPWARPCSGSWPRSGPGAAADVSDRLGARRTAAWTNCLLPGTSCHRLSLAGPVWGCGPGARQRLRPGTMVGQRRTSGMMERCYRPHRFAASQGWPGSCSDATTMPAGWFAYCEVRTTIPSVQDPLLSVRTTVPYPCPYPVAGRNTPDLAGSHRNSRAQPDSTGPMRRFRYAVPAFISKSRFVLRTWRAPTWIRFECGTGPALSTISSVSSAGMHTICTVLTRADVRLSGAGQHQIPTT